jgi:hypothetical protein
MIYLNRYNIKTRALPFLGENLGTVETAYLTKSLVNLPTLPMDEGKRGQKVFPAAACCAPKQRRNRKKHPLIMRAKLR